MQARIIVRSARKQFYAFSGIFGPVESAKNMDLCLTCMATIVSYEQFSVFARLTIN